MSEMHDLGAYRAVVQGVQEFMETRLREKEENGTMEQVTHETRGRGRSKKPSTKAVTIRMPTDVLEQVDAYIAQLAARIPGFTMERSTGIVLMLKEFLAMKASDAAQHEQSAPAQPTTHQRTRNTAPVG